MTTSSPHPSPSRGEGARERVMIFPLSPALSLEGRGSKREGDDFPPLPSPLPRGEREQESKRAREQESKRARERVMIFPLSPALSLEGRGSKGEGDDFPLSPALSRKGRGKNVCLSLEGRGSKGEGDDFPPLPSPLPQRERVNRDVALRYLRANGLDLRSGHLAQHVLEHAAVGVVFPFLRRVDAHAGLEGDGFAVLLFRVDGDF